MIDSEGILSRLVDTGKEKSDPVLSLLNSLITRARTNVPLNVNFPTHLPTDTTLSKCLSPLRRVLRNSPSSLNVNRFQLRM